MSENKIEEINDKDDKAKSRHINARPNKELPYPIGEELTFVRVRFAGNAKSHPFLQGKQIFQYGQQVIAMSDRGLTVGYINSFPYQKKFKKDMMPIRSIARLATKSDIADQMEHIDQEKRAELNCKELIEKYQLDMNITHVEYIQFSKKFVFYFNAPERVDFRNLVKDLISNLKTRIELRQISVRDRAAAIGAIGPCGLQTCCSSFLKNYGNVSIKMAKNQNLALLPNKINGVCGQIKCCMKHEDQVYSKKRSRLPSEGKYVKLKNGDCGKVLKLHILIEEFEMLTDKGQKRRYRKSEYNPKDSAPEKDWRFPAKFDHIVNEISNVIGTNEVEEKEVPQTLEEKSVPNKNKEHTKPQNKMRPQNKGNPKHENSDKITNDKTKGPSEQKEKKHHGNAQKQGLMKNNNHKRRPNKNNNKNRARVNNNNNNNIPNKNSDTKK